MNNQVQEPKGRNDSHDFDYSKITAKIYIGSDFCKGGVCLLHGEEFKALGVTFELNLSHENNELPPPNMEIGYLWLPVVDGYSPAQIQLDIGTSAMDEAVKAGKIVYIHCKNGHGRSPTMVAAYLIRFGSMDFESAQKLIVEKRPEVHIEAIQIKELKEYEKRWLK